MYAFHLLSNPKISVLVATKNSPDEVSFRLVQIIVQIIVDVFYHKRIKKLALIGLK